MKRNGKLEIEVQKLVDEFKIEMCDGKPHFPMCTANPTDSKCTAHLEAAHFTEPKQIICPRCGSLDVMKYGVRSGVQNYICRNCNSRFNAKDAPFHMWTSAEQIGAALGMFYDGMSLAKIARHLDENYHNPVNPSTVYRWVIRYTAKACDLLEIQPRTPYPEKVFQLTVLRDEYFLKTATGCRPSWPQK